MRKIPLIRDPGIAAGRSAHRLDSRPARRRDHEGARRDIEPDAAGGRPPHHRADRHRTRRQRRRVDGRDPVASRLVAIQSGGARALGGTAAPDSCRQHFRPTRRCSGCSRRDSRSLPRHRIEATERLIEHHDFRVKYPNQLSGGMQRRAELARSYVGLQGAKRKCCGGPNSTILPPADVAPADSPSDRSKLSASPACYRLRSHA
jgi:hypothetical protein